MDFVKMQGSGNDFIIIEDINDNLDFKKRNIVTRLCNRHFGIGADGILIVKRSHIADIKMIIINADGSEAFMCGNGIRCFAKYVWENKLVKKDRIIKIETKDGIKEVVLNISKNIVENITVNMGKANFEPKYIPALGEEKIINKSIIINKKQYFLNSMHLGVPHTVVFGKLDNFNIYEGRQIENLDIFPKGTNVNFCEILDKNNIKIKTWERGVGPTLACGTGSCACAIACNKFGYTNSEVVVEMIGGKVKINLNEKGTFMTGPAKTVFKGSI